MVDEFAGLATVTAPEVAAHLTGGLPSFTVSGGRIAGLDMVSGPARLRHLAIWR